MACPSTSSRCQQPREPKAILAPCRKATRRRSINKLQSGNMWEQFWCPGGRLVHSQMGSPTPLCRHRHSERLTVHSSGRAIHKPKFKLQTTCRLSDTMLLKDDTIPLYVRLMGTKGPRTVELAQNPAKVFIHQGAHATRQSRQAYSKSLRRAIASCSATTCSKSCTWKALIDDSWHATTCLGSGAPFMQLRDGQRANQRP